MTEISNLENSFVVEDVCRIITPTLSKGNQVKWNQNGMWLKADLLGCEGLAESVATAILSCSNINEYAVYSVARITELPYELKYTGCCSQDFLGAGESIITIDAIIENCNPTLAGELKFMIAEQKLTSVIELVQSVTNLDNFGIWIGMLLEFDAFILNEDRHLNNIAVIKTLNSYRLMPVFDNGAGFLSDMYLTYRMDLDTVDLIESVTSKPFDANFDNQLKALCKLLGQTLKLNDINVEYTRDEIALYSEDIRNRILHIIEIQKAKYNYLFE